MKINCELTNTTEYNQFCCMEKSVYTLKISKRFKYWYYDLCDLIDFYSDTDVDIILKADDKDIKTARKLYNNHKYNDNYLRDYETKILVHSTTYENAEKILKDKFIKSWNVLKYENKDFEKKPIGSLLGDIEDFSNYVILSLINQNNEIITASKQKQSIDTDINQIYSAGARFYLNAQRLAEDGLLLRDGEHIKVKDSISLDKYLIWYSTAERLGIEQITTPKKFFEKSNSKFFELYPQYKKRLPC